MRQPSEIEHLYLDFDGFFASVEQQLNPFLRDRPVGVIPSEATKRTCIIACSKEAKAMGLGNVMKVEEAKAVCPDLILVQQKPDMYRRAHGALLAEIETVIPIDAVKSIDELSCRLDTGQRGDPETLAAMLKGTIAENVGPFITCSIGFAANRHLAKIACKMDKPNGVTIWRPDAMPEPLFQVPLDDIPGVGSRMRNRLLLADISTTEGLYRTQPKQLRKLWRNVTGERLWYALHGYDVQAPQSKRGMFGHGRVLPPQYRTLAKAREMCRMLLIKAARRLRRHGYYCRGLWLWFAIKDSHWSARTTLPAVHDDQAVLSALTALWERAECDLSSNVTVYRVGVTLVDLCPASERQLDWLLDDDSERQRWECICAAIDKLNDRYGRTIISVGHWQLNKGANVGGKISFTRIPSAEDFW